MLLCIGKEYLTAELPTRTETFDRVGSTEMYSRFSQRFFYFTIQSKVLSGNHLQNFIRN